MLFRGEGRRPGGGGEGMLRGGAGSTGGPVAGHLGALLGGGAWVAAGARKVARLREVGDGSRGLCSDRAAGAGARATAVQKVHPRGLVTRSAMRAWSRIAPGAWGALSPEAWARRHHANLLSSGDRARSTARSRGGCGGRHLARFRHAILLLQPALGADEVRLGGVDVLGLHADGRGCRVQRSSSCRERPGNVERKPGKSRSSRNVWYSRAHSS